MNEPELDGDPVPVHRVAVLGLGNVLLGDDAFGPYVVKQLEAGFEFPSSVSVVDAGTPGLDLTPFILGQDALIVVDTVSSDAPPGTLRLYRKPNLLQAPPGPRLSPHDPGLKETLMLLDFRGDGPREVLLVGVVPGPVKTGIGLSDAVRAAADAAAAEVLRELERLGHPASPRAAPAEPDLWWER